MKSFFLSVLMTLLAACCAGCGRRTVTMIVPGTQTETNAGEGADRGPEGPGGAVETAGEPEPQSETVMLIQVFVCGEVVSPGVYTLKEGARLVEAVEAAGGFTEGADREWLNLAQRAVDSQSIRVPDLEEGKALRERSMFAEGEAPASQDSSGTPGDPRVNINTAALEELMTLPGIGKSRAEAVIAWREEHGGFTDPEQIMQISGIKNSVYDKIKDHIRV